MKPPQIFQLGTTLCSKLCALTSVSWNNTQVHRRKFGMCVKL